MAEGIAYEERGHGRLFCLGQGRSIVTMLESHGREAGVEFVVGCRIDSVEKGDGFLVKTSRGDFCSRAVVVATGGLSYPQAGASDLGYRIAEQFGLEVRRCRPGLVGLLYGPADRKWLCELSGISVDAVVVCGKQRFAEEVLFTHQGLSGPAILQASCYWREGETITIDWLGGKDMYEMLTARKGQRGAGRIGRVLEDCLPSRMVRSWAERYFVDRPLAECSLEQLRLAAESVNRWPFRPKAADDYSKAEVTLGGVSTAELSSRTFESKKVAGLYFVGEVVDVTGQLGGYNLQWAWSSGAAAGRAVGGAQD